MPTVKTAPASNHLLQKLQTELLDRSSDGAHITLVTFKGSGIKTYLRYILENKKISSFTSDRIYFWLNFKTYETGKNKMFQAAIEQLDLYNNGELEQDTLAIVEDLLRQESISKLEFSGFIKFLILEKNKAVSIVVEGIDVILKKEPTGRDILVDIAKSTDDLSYIFIQDFELEEKHKDRLGNIWNYLNSKKVCGNTYLLEKEYALTHFKEFDATLGDHSLNTIADLCESDTTIYRKVYLSLAELIEKGLVKTNNLKQAYKLIGEEWLNERFSRITRNLSDNSLKALAENELEGSTGSYLIDSGLVQQQGEDLKIYNRLFVYFLATNSASKKQDNAAFNGQELLLFNLLERNFAEIVSKEDIAKEIWGADWESKYSEWALDKLISNTRAKAKTLGKTIQSVKKRGVMLTDK